MTHPSIAGYKVARERLRTERRLAQQQDRKQAQGLDWEHDQSKREWIEAHTWGDEDSEYGREYALRLWWEGHRWNGENTETDTSCENSPRSSMNSYDMYY